MAHLMENNFLARKVDHPYTLRMFNPLTVVVPNVRFNEAIYEMLKLETDRNGPILSDLVDLYLRRGMENVNTREENALKNMELLASTGTFETLARNGTPYTITIPPGTRVPSIPFRGY